MEGWKSHGITFVEMDPPEDAFSVGTATETVRCRFLDGVDQPGPSARFGIMSARSPAIRRTPEGQFEPLVWDRRVWLVRVPEGRIPGGRGGIPYIYAGTEPVPMYYVLDGKTGDYILGLGL